MKFTIIKLRTLKEVLKSNWDSVKIQIEGKVTGLKKTIRVINRLRKMKSVERISDIHKIELFSRGEVR